MEGGPHESPTGKSWASKLSLHLSTSPSLANWPSAFPFSFPFFPQIQKKKKKKKKKKGKNSESHEHKRHTDSIKFVTVRNPNSLLFLLQSACPKLVVFLSVTLPPLRFFAHTVPMLPSIWRYLSCFFLLILNSVFMSSHFVVVDCDLVSSLMDLCLLLLNYLNLDLLFFFFFKFDFISRSASTVISCFRGFCFMLHWSWFFLLFSGGSVVVLLTCLIRMQLLLLLMCDWCEY